MSGKTPAANPLTSLTQAHKGGAPVGIYSVCSANRFVLDAAMKQAAKDRTNSLIESTSNPVNQFGGYIGMTPKQFAQFVRETAAGVGFPFERVILGGDHLGPHVWRNEPARAAMEKARQLIRAYVEAGFTKIHLDASMRLGDDPGDPRTPPADDVVAERAAELCAEAEAAWARLPAGSPELVYVTGTEAPIPGGAQAGEDAGPAATRVEEARRGIELTRGAFRARGLDAAWSKVAAIVVQPGVEFGDASVFEYDRAVARPLSKLIEKHERLIFEAHSTDYQPESALRRMVEDHFAILKVGPWFTFAFREAVFALAEMEKEWLGRRGAALSNLRETLEAVMLADPANWRKYYRGDEAALAYARKYSYSDRSRYYWPDPKLQEALGRLLTNMSAHPPPLTLLSQFMSEQYDAVRAGRITNTPADIIRDRIMKVTALLSRACGQS